MRCPICKTILGSVNNMHHRKHGITLKEFRELCGIRIIPGNFSETLRPNTAKPWVGVRGRLI